MDRKLYVGPLTDNRRWDRITLRSDDVLVVTPPKSGTTWMQTIVALLLSGDPNVETQLALKMPWLDIRLREIDDVAARIEAMAHRRCLKSHTPLDGIPYHSSAQYICVFRHPLDAHFSFLKQLRNIPMNFFDSFYPEGDEETTFRRFLDGAAEGYDMDAMPLAQIIQHFKAARAVSGRPNVTMFHYADMTRDLAGTFEHVAELLGVSHAPSLMAKLVEAATFENMQADADRFVPFARTGSPEANRAFFHSGTSGKWVGKLNAQQLDGYDYVMEENLTDEERRWLEQGSDA